MIAGLYGGGSCRCCHSCRDRHCEAVTEQIDALTTLSTNPIKYLVVPRLVAAVVSMPILTAVGDSIGVFGGYARGDAKIPGLHSGSASILRTRWTLLTSQDVSSGSIKAAAFGFIIALMGCYHGFNSRGGAQGVGAATTNAVVSSCILILATDFLTYRPFVPPNMTAKIQLIGE